MSTRLAKNNALKAIQNSIESESTENVLVETYEDEAEVVTVEETNILVPTVTQNAPEGLNLDLCKQFSRKIEYCNRELMRIHDRSANKKDQGSANK